MKKNLTLRSSFWVIPLVALLWNLMGIINFCMQMNSAMLATMPEAYRLIIEGRPLWATIGFAAAVFGGALGCLLLHFKQPAAYYLFIASLLGVMVQMLHTIGLANSKINLKPSDILLTILMPLLVSVFLVWYSKQW